MPILLDHSSIKPHSYTGNTKYFADLIFFYFSKKSLKSANLLKLILWFISVIYEPQTFFPHNHLALTICIWHFRLLQYPLLKLSIRTASSYRAISLVKLVWHSRIAKVVGLSNMPVIFFSELRKVLIKQCLHQNEYFRSFHSNVKGLQIKSFFNHWKDLILQGKHGHLQLLNKWLLCSYTGLVSFVLVD